MLRHKRRSPQKAKYIDDGHSARQHRTEHLSNSPTSRAMLPAHEYGLAKSALISYLGEAKDHGHTMRMRYHSCEKLGGVVGHSFSESSYWRVESHLAKPAKFLVLTSALQRQRMPVAFWISLSCLFCIAGIRPPPHVKCCNPRRGDDLPGYLDFSPLSDAHGGNLERFHWLRARGIWRAGPFDRRRQTPARTHDACLSRLSRLPNPTQAAKAFPNYIGRLT